MIPDDCYARLKECVELCAINLNKPVNELLDSHWEEPHMQRRATEKVHEEAWNTVFEGLGDGVDGITGDILKARFVENSSGLARYYRHAFPTDRMREMPRDCVRYGLRRTHLSEFRELAGRGTRCQNGCGEIEDAMHHLTCSCTQRKRTLRHTAIKNIVAMNCRKVFGNSKVETLVGEGCQADVQCYMGEGRLETIEVSVTSVRPRKHKVKWPSNQDVLDGLAEDAAAGPPLKGPLFFWNDHSKENPHPDVLYYRKRRQL